MAAHSAERAGDERWRAGEDSGRKARRTEGVHAEGGVKEGIFGASKRRVSRDSYTEGSKSLDTFLFSC